MSDDTQKIIPARKVRFAFLKRFRAKWEYFKVQAQIPTNSVIPRVIGYTLVWTVVYNVLVYYWKGPDHPRNMFRFREMVQKGELPPDVLIKAKIIDRASNAWVESFFGGRNFWQKDRFFAETPPPVGPTL